MSYEDFELDLSSIVRYIELRGDSDSWADQINTALERRGDNNSIWSSELGIAESEVIEFVSKQLAVAVQPIRHTIATMRESVQKYTEQLDAAEVAEREARFSARNAKRNEDEVKTYFFAKQRKAEKEFPVQDTKIQEIIQQAKIEIDLAEANLVTTIDAMKATSVISSVIHAKLSIMKQHLTQTCSSPTEFNMFNVQWSISLSVD